MQPSSSSCSTTYTNKTLYHSSARQNINSTNLHHPNIKFYSYIQSSILIKYAAFVPIKRTFWLCVSYSQWVWQGQFLLASILIQFNFLPSSFLLNVQITMWSRVGCVSWYLITQSGMTKHQRCFRYRYEYSNIRVDHFLSASCTFHLQANKKIGPVSYKTVKPKLSDKKILKQKCRHNVIFPRSAAKGK